MGPWVEGEDRPTDMMIGVGCVRMYVRLSGGEGRREIRKRFDGRLDLVPDLLSPLH